MVGQLIGHDITIKDGAIAEARAPPSFRERKNGAFMMARVQIRSMIELHSRRHVRFTVMVANLQRLNSVGPFLQA